jgi:hypothetical protein
LALDLRRALRTLSGTKMAIRIRKVTSVIIGNTFSW